MSVLSDSPTELFSHTPNPFASAAPLLFTDGREKELVFSTMLHNECNIKETAYQVHDPISPVEASHADCPLQLLFPTSLVSFNRG